LRVRAENDLQVITALSELPKAKELAENVRKIVAQRAAAQQSNRSFKLDRIQARRKWRALILVRNQKALPLTERLQRIDFGGPARRHITGEQCQPCQQQRCAEE
jgi:hypothetical protein